jgi:UMF1 family MFS transporter
VKNKKVKSWALYDWANSAFATTVMAGFFPVFFKEFWSEGTDPTLTTARLGTVVSIASVSIAFLSPLLGALADRRGYKKTFLFFWMLIGAFCTAALAFVPQGLWLGAALLYGLAMMGFNASSVFYDSLLPSVAKPSETNYASSLGFAMGYLGGGILFLLNVLMFLHPQTFGLRDGAQAIQFSFISVALWWSIFSIPLFRNVPEPNHKTEERPLTQAITHSFYSLWSTTKEIYQHKNLLFFLLAYWLYIDGVYTVITMAVDYGLSLGFKSSDLITALLIVQFVGFPFALLFSKFAGRFGSRKPILVCLGIYALTVIFAVQMENVWQFYLLALLIGMVQGGVQALSRSLFARMIPEQKSGEYFGLFNLVGKFASIFGPIVVGWGAFLSGNPRMGMLGLLVLFVLGGGLLMLVHEPQSSSGAS